MAWAMTVCPPLRGWHSLCPLSQEPYGEGRVQGPGNPHFSPGSARVPTLLASMGPLVPEDIGWWQETAKPCALPRAHVQHSTLSMAGLGWCWSQPCHQPVMGISSVCPDAALTPPEGRGLLGREQAGDVQGHGSWKQDRC